jgi:hypothetical protein
MLEFMGTSNEHIFPIDCDFVQFVAVLSPPNSHPPAARMWRCCRPLIPILLPREEHMLLSPQENTP